MSLNYSNLEGSTNVRFNTFKIAVTRKLSWIMYSLFPAQVKKILYKRMFTPPSYKVSNDETKMLYYGKEFQIKVNGKSIKSWKWGNGPSILFVHGWGGRGIQFHHFIVQTLAKGYSVISFDAPGHGSSEGQYSNYFEFSDAVKFFIKRKEELNIVGLVGHSFGGAAIINSLFKTQIKLPAVLISPIFHLKETFISAFTKQGIPLTIYHEIRDRLNAKYNSDFEKENPANLLNSIDQKLLVFHDRDDRYVPFSQTFQLTDSMENIQLISTRDLGHKRILSNHIVIVEVIDHIINRSNIPEKATYPESATELFGERLEMATQLD